MLVRVPTDVLTRSIEELSVGKVISFRRNENKLFFEKHVVADNLPDVMQRPVYYGTVSSIEPLFTVISVARFADLHRHSDYSLLDGICKVSDMVQHSVPQGALTDHGVLYGFLDYYKSMRAAGKKPIIGFEAYTENMDAELSRDHLILLAKNEIGYKNILKLCSNAFANMKKGRPHVLMKDLVKRHEGVIATSACLGNTIPKLLVAGKEEKAEYMLQFYIKTFGTDDFYLEIQRHGIPEEGLVEKFYKKWAKKYGLKIIATTDSHYTNKEDSYAHEVALCMQTGKTMMEPHMKFPGSGYHVHTSEEMESLFADIPEVLENTLELADKCNVELKLGDVNLPDYPIPAPYHTPEDFFIHLCEEGYESRFGGRPEHDDPQYRERYDYEMAMIRKMGFVSYFIIVWDFINFARSHNIYVGPGRGSAAGSLLAYCIGITDLDPIKLNLLFERFLNPERVSWPDVDTDIEYSGRKTVIEYIKQKYGAANVCHIITFGTMAARMVIKDVGRVLGFPASFTANLAKLVPAEVGMTIKKALAEAPDLKYAYESDNDTKTIIDLAVKLEGCKRHASQHACGLVIAPSEVSDFLPTAMVKNDETGEVDITSQVVMTEVEELSLLKMDLLGLKNLGVIHESIDSIYRNYGIRLDYHDIPLNDRRTLQFLAEGNTGGVFQLESPGMTKIVTNMLEDVSTLSDDDLDQGFERLIAAVALYRPGPMDYIPDYLEGMKNPNKIHYDCPEEAEILASTYGVMVYQEQLMQIAQKLAGYTLGRADLLRKACGKKKKKLMDAEHTVFVGGNETEFNKGNDKTLIPGCTGNQISAKIAEEIWAKMVKFAAYAFNRSHAACYAYIAMITAWLSCYYPNEFYAAMLNAFVENSDKFKEYLVQINRRNLTILPPNVNISNDVFVVEKQNEKMNIRYGLRGLKGMKKVADALVKERHENGNFTSFQDLYQRMQHTGVSIEKKSFESLLYSGSLDVFGKTKQSLLKAFPLFVSNSKSEKKVMEGQVSLFDGSFGEEYTQYNLVPIPDLPEMDERSLMDLENSVLGFYLTKHPTEIYEKALMGTNRFCCLSDIDCLDHQDVIITVGMIRKMRKLYTRNEDEMFVFELESRYISEKCVIFPKNVASNRSALEEDKIVKIQGRISCDDEHGRQIIVEQVVREDSILVKMSKLIVQIEDKAQQENVLQWAKSNPGNVSFSLSAKGRIWPMKQKVALSVSGVNYLMDHFTIEVS